MTEKWAKRPPNPGEDWRNNKHGTLYRVVGYAMHHRTGELMVRYVNTDGEEFVRELDGCEDCWHNRFTFHSY